MRTSRQVWGSGTDDHRIFELSVCFHWNSVSQFPQMPPLLPLPNGGCLGKLLKHRELAPHRSSFTEQNTHQHKGLPSPVPAADPSIIPSAQILLVANTALKNNDEK